jgi:tetratricopeptide (TPR) repeat protein
MFSFRGFLYGALTALDARLAMVLLGLVLTAAAPPAFPEPPRSRTEALAALRSAGVTARAEGVVWFANRGAMADAPLLHERLRDESGFVRSYAEQALWLLWSRSGDAQIDALMAKGVEAMQGGRHDEAIALFSTVIKRKPEFAEGWNKRATVYYLAGEFDKSIADCHEVLKRNPGHFGALSGMGQIYFQLENSEAALLWYRKAFEVNPNMLGVEMQIRLLEQQLRDPPAPGRST